MMRNTPHAIAPHAPENRFGQTPKEPLHEPENRPHKLNCQNVLICEELLLFLWATKPR